MIDIAKLRSLAEECVSLSKTRIHPEDDAAEDLDKDIADARANLISAITPEIVVALCEARAEVGRLHDFIEEDARLQKEAASILRRQEASRGELKGQVKQAEAERDEARAEAHRGWNAAIEAAADVAMRAPSSANLRMSIAAHIKALAKPDEGGPSDG